MVLHQVFDYPTVQGLLSFLEDGIKQTYDWFLDNIENFKQVKLT